MSYQRDKFTVQLWTDSTDLAEPTIRFHKAKDGGGIHCAFKKYANDNSMKLLLAIKLVNFRTVAEAGFKMIFSNHDATYLDCGFGAWVYLSTLMIFVMMIMMTMSMMMTTTPPTLTVDLEPGSACINDIDRW